MADLLKQHVVFQRDIQILYAGVQITYKSYNLIQNLPVEFFCPEHLLCYCIVLIKLHFKELLDYLWTTTLLIFKPLILRYVYSKRSKFLYYSGFQILVQNLIDGWLEVKKRKEHKAQSVLGFAYGLAVVTVPKQPTQPILLSGFPWGLLLLLFAESLNSQVVTFLFTELTHFQLLQLHFMSC